MRDTPRNEGDAEEVDALLPPPTLCLRELVTAAPSVPGREYGLDAPFLRLYILPGVPAAAEEAPAPLARDLPPPAEVIVAESGDTEEA